MTQQINDIKGLKERYESLHNLYESGDWIRDMKLDEETTADVLETFESMRQALLDARDELRTALEVEKSRIALHVAQGTDTLYDKDMFRVSKRVRKFVSKESEKDLVRPYVDLDALPDWVEVKVIPKSLPEEHEDCIHITTTASIRVLATPANGGGYQIDEK